MFSWAGNEKCYPYWTRHGIVSERKGFNTPQHYKKSVT